ncbi:PREDICTED: protein HRB1-like isoform X2 [Camelina sativa]|uniref:Protein HRB1-like isoform X2 n=1 Tax=Camelina sativa TaxID=90675 RepID=A0ABM1QS60_CAMSA|nr:PREDICTED: protein HRB1-like isoform X2 [Camelina sativa]
MCCGLVEFSSTNEAKKAVEKKNGEYLHDYRIHLKVHKKNPNIGRPKFCIDHTVCYKDYLRPESLPVEDSEAVKGLDETPDFVEEVLFVANISPQTKLFHIKDFFKDVGEVVRVRLIVNHEGKHVGYGFVDFAYANEAKKALEKKNGEYLHDHKIFLEVAKTAPPRPKYNLAEKLCYEDYLRRQNLLIKEDGTAVEGLDETPNFVEAVAVRNKTLFVSHISRKANISHIINFFKDVGEVVHVRLTVDYTGKHVGDGFVEFASANEAETALEKKNGEYLQDRKIFLDVAKKAPYPLRPKYCIDHKVWYEDYLRRESLLIEEDEAVEGQDELLDYIEEVAATRKTIFIANISCETSIPMLLRFFKNVGRVVLLRLIVDHRGEDVGCGFVEFVSANEAEKALRIIHDKEFGLEVAEIAPYPLRPKYNLAEKLW